MRLSSEHMTREAGRNLHRVRLGPIELDDIANLQRELESIGYVGSYVANS